MSCPVSAGAAETANGAVERMVLLGLTGVYYIKFGCLSWGSLLVKGKGQRDWKDERDMAGAEAHLSEAERGKTAAGHLPPRAL